MHINWLCSLSRLVSCVVCRVLVRVLSAFFFFLFFSAAAVPTLRLIICDSCDTHPVFCFRCCRCLTPLPPSLFISRHCPSTMPLPRSLHESLLPLPVPLYCISADPPSSGRLVCSVSLWAGMAACIATRRGFHRPVPPRPLINVHSFWFVLVGVHGYAPTIVSLCPLSLPCLPKEGGEAYDRPFVSVGGLYPLPPLCGGHSFLAICCSSATFIGNVPFLYRRRVCFTYLSTVSVSRSLSFAPNTLHSCPIAHPH